MRRLSRHVGTTIFFSITLALLVLVGLDVVAAIIDEAGDTRNNYQFSDALVYVGTKLPSTIYEYIAFSSLIGCLFGLGMLASNGEVIVMRASGVSLLRIVFFVIRPVLLFVLLAAAIGEYFSPYLDQLADGRREYLRKGDSALDSSSGLWNHEGTEFMHFNAVFPGGVLFGVSRFQFDDDRRLQEASFSSRATYNATEDVWVEENVSITRFEQDRTETDKQITRRWDSELTPEVLTLNILPPDSLSIASLHQYIDFLDQQNLDNAQYKLAFWTKVLQPLVIIGLVMIGISFVFGPLRDSTMGFRIFIGVVIGVSFRIIQDMLGPFSIVFGFPPVLAVLLPVFFCAAVGLYLLRRGG
ncbi:MAG: LPS export ABC transporter permease LptG [Porticoccaceae bacterium]|jgi:lipopolysaccharide export system permease protein|nr:LPS export ABC transporter permease LptG [Porticoccaceae bacterium]